MNQKVKSIGKKVLTIIAATAVVVYIVYAIFHFNRERDNSLCMGVEVAIMDSSDIQFIHPGDVKNVIKDMEPELAGKNMNSLNTTLIERTLVKRLIAIKDVEVYKTPESKLRINIWQRHPVLRIIKDSGFDCYIDSEGKSMPIPSLDPAYVPVATGVISDTFATNTLFKFAKFLQKDKFWNAQIEQIHVKYNGDVNLVPRVGGHIIEMGKLTNYKEKLDKLEKVYAEAFPEKGWDIYSTINLKFDQQVVCTKK
ncbi:MAG: hypothetical protein MJZ02_09360 [Paludibacteraceae bacterium]|nr:hypothetical protein [Paludibacteraceae bacterium]